MNSDVEIYDNGEGGDDGNDAVEDTMMVMAGFLLVTQGYQMLAQNAGKFASIAPRERTGYKRREVPDPEKAFWRSLDRSGSESAFIHFLSFSREAFNSLVELCTPMLVTQSLHPSYAQGTPQEHHKKCRKFPPRDIIAMTLWWILSTAGHKDLCIHFGCLESAYAQLVCRGNEVLVHMLRNHPKARVYWNFLEENMKSCAHLTRHFKDMLNVVAFVDGMKLDSFHSSDVYQQNNDYNSWGSDCFRKCILIWDPRGKVVACHVNHPGSMHDSRSSKNGGIYDIIERLPQTYVCICDSAFKVTHECIKKSGHYQFYDDFFLDDGPQYEPTPQDNQSTSLRQASEWGNDILVNGCWHLKMRLPTPNGDRAFLLWVCIFLHNYRMETMNINQIWTYF